MSALSVALSGQVHASNRELRALSTDDNRRAQPIMPTCYFFFTDITARVAADDDRMDDSHLHACRADGRHVLVPDLGADKLWVMELQPGGEMGPRGYWKSQPGSGPRHLAAHPNGEWVYLICEMSCQIVALRWTAVRERSSILAAFNCHLTAFQCRKRCTVL